MRTRIYADRQAGALDVSDCTEAFYNRIRRHSHLGGVGPIEFEAAHRPRRSDAH